MAPNIINTPSHSHTLKRITLGITGASGIPYATRLLESLLLANCSVSLVCSPAAHIVAKEEMKWAWPAQPQALKRWFIEHLTLAPEHAEQLQVYGHQYWKACIASGSNVDDAMVVCPCSMGTVAAIAMGLSDSLIERAADVALKEHRPLILVPRETPLSTIHLENLLKLSKMGVVILPPVPAFYHEPQTIGDLVDFVVARILDQLRIPNQLMHRWGSKT